ncbi:MAG: acyl-CoA desaturase [Phycisphaerae bacterium]
MTTTCPPQTTPPTGVEEAPASGREPKGPGHSHADHGHADHGHGEHGRNRHNHNGHDQEHDHYVSPLLKFINLMVVVVPFLGVIAAVIWTWGWGVNATALGILAVMWFCTAIGITLGYHRLFTHRSFETNKFVRGMLGIFGSMAIEGPILFWVAIHRRHHQHSDHAEDPHSPHLHGEGFKGLLKGLWHAHAGWMVAGRLPGGLMRYVGDLRKDKVTRFVSSTFWYWVALGFLVPTIAGGLLMMSWTGALMGFLWGGLVRLFLVHHITWSINSVCHLWGYQSFPGDDESRNNPVFGILGLGEGWHNNHHAFPSSARHGLKWYEFDASYYMIRGLELVGLAWKVKTPSPEAMAAKLARAEREQGH